VPKPWRLRLLRRLLGINGQPADAYERLAILANCAPHLLQALNEHPWEAIVLIQTSMAPWLQFLPTFGAKIIYFHDVRSDYLARNQVEAGTSRTDVEKVHYQEQLASSAADAVGFVSSLDRDRAAKLMRLPATSHVAPIPVDTEYFHPCPSNHVKSSRKIVLFTGHLRHPPNVDAVIYFLREIWPRVLSLEPTATFQAVGLTPSPEVIEEIGKATQAELHANVPDIRTYFWDASAYVVPMRFGGGVRQKIFEAWSMRIPVVSTTMGVEGTAARDGINCWLADEPIAFAERVASLISRPAPVAMLEAAEIGVKSTNSISVAAGAFADLVQKGISARRSRPFRLLYDLRWMKIGEAGGVEQMTYELIHAISRIDRTNFYRAYAPRSAFQEWDLSPTFKCQRFYSDQREKTWEGIRTNIANRLAESLHLPPVLTPEMRTLRAYREMDFDIVHSMLGYVHPDLQAFPNILTVLDLQHLTYPQFFTPQEWEIREHLYRSSAQRATHITCISEFTRQEVHKHYGIPLERMTTIWIAPSRNIREPLLESERIRLLARMGVPGRFLFFPAHCWPHKNHARLIDAFALILPHIDKDINLVLTGRPFPEDHPARAAIKGHGLQARVLHLGYRSPLEIRALFQSCLVLVFPSLFEGFGMPLAEAILAGKPVACSNVTSLPEIAGDAALTFDPLNIHDIGGRLLEIINDPKRRSQLVAAAHKRRPLFSAQKIAVETLSLYHRVFEALYA
jgi:glycosyltransferase involved in cell wall biosynthesis